MRHVAVRVEPGCFARDVVGDDEVATLALELSPRRLHEVVALRGEAHHDAVALLAADLREDVRVADELERDALPGRKIFLLDLAL
jgi:hypothetical protein